MLDTECLSTYDYSAQSVPANEEEAESNFDVQQVEIILGILAFTILLLIVCIIWISCHPKKGDRSKDTQIVDESSIVKDLVVKSDENIDFAPVSQAFVNKVTKGTANKTNKRHQKVRLEKVEESDEDDREDLSSDEEQNLDQYLLGKKTAKHHEEVKMELQNLQSMKMVEDMMVRQTSLLQEDEEHDS